MEPGRVVAEAASKLQAGEDDPAAGAAFPARVPEKIVGRRISGDAQASKKVKELTPRKDDVELVEVNAFTDTFPTSEPQLEFAGVDEEFMPLHAVEDFPELPDIGELVQIMAQDNGEMRTRYRRNAAVALLATNQDMGLSAADIKHRHMIYGKNVLKRRTPDSLWTLIKNNANDLVMWLICGAGVGAMAVDAMQGESAWWLGGTCTLATVTMVVVFSAVFEYYRERQFIRLLDNVDTFRVVVLREGNLTTITAQEVVVGDIVQLESGDVPPGDGLLIQASGTTLTMDESPLTGESEGVEKATDDDNAIYGSTTVTGGQGQMVVLCTGVHSLAGQIQRAIEEEEDDDDDNDKSGLEKRLEEMAEMLGYTCFKLAIVFFIFTVLEIFILGAAGVVHDEFDDPHDYIDAAFDLFVASLLLLILGIPEGLPVAISLTLVLGAKQMEAENVLVKKPKKGEVMGTVTTICTDKTGTLTTGNMVVKSVIIGGVEFNSLTHMSSALPEDVVDQFVLNIALNSTCRISTKQNPIAAGMESGNMTEKALLRMLEEHFEVDFNPLRAAHKAAWAAPFSSARKASSIAVPLGGKYMLYTKGAPEVVMELCTHVVNEAGEPEPLRDTQRAELSKLVSMHSMRCVCLAARELPADFNPRTSPQASAMEAGAPTSSPERDLTLTAFVFINDPLRHDVPAALNLCRGAGVRVIMVTGDSATTARAIALESGLLLAGEVEGAGSGAVLEGPQFRKMVSLTALGLKVPEGDDDFNQVAFDKIWPSLKCLVRSSPVDKLLLVKGLMNSRLYETGRPDIHPNKQVVAVTGDGVNDIPAMSKAHVGVAMGGGQQAAIEASEVVLTDNNFASCVTGIMWGRNIREAACRFIQFQITITCVFVLYLVFSVVFLFETLPLTLIQSLWLNLIQDTLGAVALASDPAHPNILKRRPIHEDAPLISKMMMRNIVGQTIYQTVILLVVVLNCDRFFEIDSHPENQSKFSTTIAFNFVVLQTMANTFSSRVTAGEYNFFVGLHKNPWFCTILSVEFILQIVMSNYCRSFMGTEFLSFETWMKLCTLSALGVWGYYILMNAVWWKVTTKSFEFKSELDQSGKALEKRDMLQNAGDRGGDKYGSASTTLKNKGENYTPPVPYSSA